MAKSQRQLAREVAEVLGRRKTSPVSLRYPYYDPEFPNPQSKIKEPWNNHRPRRQDMRDPTLPKDEKFAVVKEGRVLATATSVAGAMSKAPDKGDVDVRGEYVSTGAHFGLGRGRLLATRERGKWIRY